MSIYDDVGSVVSEVMDEFKQGIIALIKVTPASGPADNPGTPTETSYPLDATIKGVSFKYVQDGLAVSSDMTVTAVPISGVTPSEKDFITIDGTRYKIVSYIPLPPTTDVLVWKFIVRKGG